MDCGDIITLASVKILRDYLITNVGDSGEGFWQHKDGDTIYISIGSFLDDLNSLEKLLQKRLEKYDGGKNEQH